MNTAKVIPISRPEKPQQPPTAGILVRAVAVWLVFIGIETVLGTLRVLFLEPRIGRLPAQRMGFITGCIALFLVAWFLIGWVRAGSRKALLWIGLLWAALTFGFEMALGRAQSKTWESLLADYNPLRGGLMSLALLLLLLAPLIAARLRAGSRVERN